MDPFAVIRGNRQIATYPSYVESMFRFYVDCKQIGGEWSGVDKFPPGPINSYSYSCKIKDVSKILIEMVSNRVSRSAFKQFLNSDYLIRDIERKSFLVDRLTKSGSRPSINREHLIEKLNEEKERAIYCNYNFEFLKNRMWKGIEHDLKQLIQVTNTSGKVMTVFGNIGPVIFNKRNKSDIEVAMVPWQSSVNDPINLKEFIGTGSGSTTIKMKKARNCDITVTSGGYSDEPFVDDRGTIYPTIRNVEVICDGSL